MGNSLMIMSILEIKGIFYSISMIQKPESFEL